MKTTLHIQPVSTRRELGIFVNLPWKIYVNDENWVPPLISEQLNRLDPSRGAFHGHAEVILFLAYQGKEPVGRIAAYIDHRRVAHLSRQVGAFGFFETLPDYSYAEALLDAAVDWLWERNIAEMVGPACFTDFEYPGVLIEGFDHPPVTLAAHSPPYYQDYLTTYGLELHQEFSTWRIFANQMENVLPEITSKTLTTNVEEQFGGNFLIRKLRMEDWEADLRIVHRLVNESFMRSPSYVPVSAEDFLQIMDMLRVFVDPDLVRVVEADGQPIAAICAIPDRNRVLRQMDGRLSTIDRIRMRRLISQIDVTTLLFIGVLERYQESDIEGQLYRDLISTLLSRGFGCLSGNDFPGLGSSSSSLKDLLGAETYRRYQLLKLHL